MQTENSRCETHKQEYEYIYLDKDNIKSQYYCKQCQNISEKNDPEKNTKIVKIKELKKLAKSSHKVQQDLYDSLDQPLKKIKMQQQDVFKKHEDLKLKQEEFYKLEKEIRDVEFYKDYSKYTQLMQNPFLFQLKPKYLIELGMDIYSSVENLEKSIIEFEEELKKLIPDQNNLVQNNLVQTNTEQIKKGSIQTEQTQQEQGQTEQTQQEYAQLEQPKTEQPQKEQIKIEYEQIKKEQIKVELMQIDQMKKESLQTKLIPQKIKIMDIPYEEKRNYLTAKITLKEETLSNQDNFKKEFNLSNIATDTQTTHDNPLLNPEDQNVESKHHSSKSYIRHKFGESEQNQEIMNILALYHNQILIYYKEHLEIINKSKNQKSNSNQSNTQNKNIKIKIEDEVLNFQVVDSNKIFVHTSKGFKIYDNDLNVNNAISIIIDRNHIDFREGTYVYYEKQSQTLKKVFISKQQSQECKLNIDNAILLSLKIIEQKIFLGFNNGKIHQFSFINLQKENEIQIPQEQDNLTQILFEKDYIIAIEKNYVQGICQKQKERSFNFYSKDTIMDCACIIKEEKKQIELHCLQNNQRVHIYKIINQNVKMNGNKKEVLASLITSYKEKDTFFYVQNKFQIYGYKSQKN